MGEVMSRRASSARWFGTGARNGVKGLRAAVTALVAASLLLAGTAPANAVGPAQLSIEITAIDPVTLEPVTVTGYNQHNNKLAYRVGYSCSLADCTDAVVKLPMTNLDPNYNQFRLLDYENWTPPAGTTATIANVPATGATVRLGTVPAGTAATFVVQFVRAITTSAPGVVPASYFPDGYQIQQSATISSPTAQADAMANAAPVTWQTGVGTPAITKTGPANVRPDTDMTYTIGMSDGCLINRGSNRWTSSGAVVCARSYTVVDQLPAQAVFVSAGDGGVYDVATHTVTWTKSGLGTPGVAGAAGGWGAPGTSGWTTGYGFNPRTVTVKFPASAFPEGADGADFIAPVTNNASVSVTYLDDASTVKTASTSFKNDVVRVEPFGRADHSKSATQDQVVSNTRFVNVPPNTAGLVCGSNNRDDWGRVCVAGQPVAPFATQTGHYWIVSTSNQGNVPGIATVVDNDLGNSDVRVRRIATSGGTGAPTIAWTISNGTQTTTGTTTATTYTAPAGSWLTAATITSGSLAGPNLLQTGTASTVFTVNFGYDVPVGSPLFTWTNNASATMTYPDQPQITPIAKTSTAAVTFRDTPKVVVPVTPPSFNAGFDGAPVVEGGGNVVPGGKVTFGVRGSTANIPTGRNVSPQYVFIAPAGWTIFPNSASFPAGSVPAGVSYVYKNVTIAGVSRQAVIASWPTGATFGSNATWPTMSVNASPTATVAAGTTSTAAFWVSDSRNSYDPSATTWATKTIDSTDVDGDGNTTEAFATVTTNVTVSGTQRLDVIKEICVEKDGTCTWISNPDVIVGAAPNATDIKYRVTLVNSANTTLSGVVGYDVLPHVGDGRSSTFAETLNSITSTSNLTLSYSGSTNPCRAEVRPTNPGCDSDWTAAAAGAQSIRAVVNGSLAPGATARFEFTANVVGAAANAVACNSVAVDSTPTLPSEPRPVCVTTQEADLSVTVPERLPLQGGRPGTVPFTVTNLGGSPSAPATVKIDVPTGIRITSLTPSGWVCTSSDTKPDGSVLGPITLTCDAVTATGTSRSLALGVPDALDLPAVVPDVSLVGDDTCFPAKVSGLMFDPQLANNDTSACFAVVAGDSLISLTKDDGVTQVGIGAELTYTLTVSNQLVGESLGAVTVTDQLPANVAFVSASNGGVVTAQGAADATGALPGGTVTWTLASLDAAGVAGDGTDGATGAPGSSTSVTVTVRVLQSAETLTQIVNTASVSAVDPLNPDAQLTDTAEDTDATVRLPGISLVKTADAATYSTADGTVTYTFRATNTGNVTFSGISIVEGAFTGSGALSDVTCPTSALAPGASLDCSATYAVTLADLDRGTISNTARATGTPVAGLSAPVSTPSTVVITAAQQPALTLVKSATPTTAVAVDDEVTYSFLVTNSGNVTVTDVGITETAFDGDSENLSDIVCPAAGDSLAAGASVTCEATYALTQADVDRGSVTNSATATASAAGDLEDPVSEPSTAVVTVPAAAALTLTKSVSGSAADEAGDTLSYLFVVTNTGNVTVANVGISETDFTGTGEAVDITCPTTPLAPAGELSCTGTYELTQADVDAGEIENTAIATAVVSEDIVESAPSTASVTIDPDSELTLVKSVSSGDFGVGDEIAYSFLVTNTGNVTVSDIAIDEAMFTGTGSVSDILCESTSLAPDAQTDCSATYTITQTDVDAGTVDNTAIAKGQSPSDEAVSSEASTAELPLAQAPALTVTKTADVDTYSAVDDAIGYQFRVTNTGDVTLTSVAITETAFTGSGSLDDATCATTPLAPGEFMDCTVDYKVQQGDLDRGSVSNTATATATPPAGLTAPTSSPSTVVVTAEQEPALTLTKSVAPTTAVAAGDEVTYSFLVTNSGNVTVTDVEITETAFDGDSANLSAIVCPAEGDSLAPAASVTCTATYELAQADVDRGSVSNSATATADAPGDLEDPVSTASTAVVTVSAAPALTLTKSVSGSAADEVGDTVSYLFVVTNTGNVTVANVGISETAFTGTGEAVAIDCPTTPLAPAGEVTCTGTYELTQADVDAGGIDNTAIATADAPDESQVASPPSSARATIDPDSELTLVKSVSSGDFGLGDEITYSFAVTNTGNVTVSDIVIDETLFSGTGSALDILCESTSLAADAQTECAATYTITQADVDAGTIDNTAIATGLAPSGPVSSDASTVELPLNRDTALTVTKTADVAAYSAVGDVIAYQLRVANTGNVTLTGVAITETAFTGSGSLDDVACPTTPLAPGESVDCTVDYEIQQGDLDRGSVSNTATATATPPVGLTAPTSGPSTAVVTATQVPALTLVKSVAPTTAVAAGDEVTYSFLVTNSGNVTLTDVEITETAFDGDSANLSDIACPSEGDSLAPGASVTCTATYDLVLADADRGSVTNTATATADAPGDIVNPVSEASTAVVTVPAAAALILEKSVDSKIATTAGGTLTYLFAVTNTGNVTVSDIGIDETSFTGTGAPVVIECPATSLAPGGEMTCVGTYVLTQADVDAGRLDNTATVHGTSGGTPVESDPSTVEFDINPHGALALVKSVALGALEVGEQISYSFVVTNIGNVTVTSVAIEETTFTGSGEMSDIVCDTVDVAPEAQAVCSASYTITQADVDAGTIENTAVATGVAPSGDVQAPAEDVSSNGSTARLPFTLAPALTVEKTADVAGYSAVGDVIGYRFRVVNTGNTTLSGVEIVEGEFTGTGALGSIECSLVTLLPGQIAECAADYAVTQGDIDAGQITNTAHAQASSPLEESATVSNDSSVTVAFGGENGLVLTKTGTAVDLDANGVANPGDQIAWTFTVTNTGVTTLTGVAIEDPTAGAVTCASTVLPPGATITCEAPLHKISAADAAAGRVVNVATASAVGVSGVVIVSDKATASVDVKALPLAMTGLTSQGAVNVAVLLLLLGAAAVWFTRQRRQTHP